MKKIWHGIAVLAPAIVALSLLGALLLVVSRCDARSRAEQQARYAERERRRDTRCDYPALRDWTQQCVHNQHVALGEEAALGTADDCYSTARQLFCETTWDGKGRMPWVWRDGQWRVK